MKIRNVYSRTGKRFELHPWKSNQYAIFTNDGVCLLKGDWNAVVRFLNAK